jgi:DNA mismatch repair protein MutS2
VVEANNELVQAIREEESEVVRVLAALTDAVREALPELEALLAGMAQLDLVFARAELGERMAATQPRVSADRVVALRAARNPLLLAQAEKEPGRAVVPVDIELDGARPLLVITGPNAGGKTVTLKTLALLALMAQSGLHIPADDGARLPVFSQVFAIVGDDQSVAENLSTFSAFVKQLRDVLEHVDDRSLVVLDELGAGTDPDDGAALAQAVLEELAQRGALCIASTHLEPLKGFASTHPRARNASVEFDQERLAPTFRLVYDRPGQSYALAIGARLGLAPALIERAYGYRSRSSASSRSSWRACTIGAARGRERRDDRAARGRERRAPQPGRGRARGGAHGGARHAGARAGRGQAGRRGHPARGQRGVGAPAPRREEPRRSHAEPQARARRGGSGGPPRRRVGPDEPGVGPVGPGDRVEIAHLGLKGEILAVDGGTATVRAGAVTVKVPVQAVRRAAAQGPSRPMGQRPAAKGGVEIPDKSSVAGELRLIGKTTDEARDLLEEYLDDAFMAGLPSVRIIHGKGTGAVRRAVEDVLSTHPLVTTHRPGSASEGGGGATVAALGQS